MRYFKTTTSALAAGALYLAAATALSAASGCGGEAEAPILSTDKNKDQLQREIENPLGEVAPKARGKARKGARARD